jgi:alpha-galactosidase
MNIDDCYSEKKRNAKGDIVARMSFCLYGSFLILTRMFVLSDKTRFPSGMNNLTDQIHSLGMKAGIVRHFEIRNEQSAHSSTV